ncbi:hypothetical protein [Hyphomonas oceanitis]|uniref:Putative lipoprotein n=1 Tax=Hyphomonas oceanitis SCH89 TaxID=1280953 RepID=A0A059GC56_9PROT|nr:hypothetical protein [Hyphomonas oceanitis]KDA04180.1 putative lipoprotein [Hyphomonas oceanitis SCH89]
MINNWKTTVALGAIIALSACNSSGSKRFASVGTTTPQAVSPKPMPTETQEPVTGNTGGTNGTNGNNGGTTGGSGGGTTGGTGEGTMAGPAGPAGPAGEPGEPGQQFAFGDAGMIATGGLVGPDGLAGTGLFANLGDPSTTMPVGSDTSNGMGSVFASLEEGTNMAMNDADQTGTLSPAVAPVTQTIGNVGDTLTAFGSTGEPLVDGLTSSVAPILTASVGQATAAGDTSETSALGLSVLSPEQTSGTLGEIGVASNDTLLNVDLATSTDTGLAIGDVASVDLGPVTDGLNGLNDLNDTSGSTASSPLGLSVLSEEQNSGTLAEVGVASNDTLLNVDLATSTDTGLTVGDVATVDLGPVTAALDDTIGETLPTDTSTDTPVTSAVTGLFGGLGLQ